MRVQTSECKGVSGDRIGAGRLDVDDKPYLNTSSVRKRNRAIPTCFDMEGAGNMNLQVEARVIPDSPKSNGRNPMVWTTHQPNGPWFQTSVGMIDAHDTLAPSLSNEPTLTRLHTVGSHNSSPGKMRRRKSDPSWSAGSEFRMHYYAAKGSPSGHRRQH